MTAHKPSTRDTILDAAETVVGRDGARRLTIDAVAAEACVSKGGVLYHFPNKVALLKGMVERMLADISQDFADCEAAAHAAGEPPLVHVFNAMFDRHDARKALSMALLAASAEHPDLLDPARDFLSSTFQRLSDDTPDPIGARLLLLAMDGLKLSALLGFDTIPENQLTQIRDRLVRLTHELYQ